MPKRLPHIIGNPATRLLSRLFKVEAMGGAIPQFGMASAILTVVGSQTLVGLVVVLLLLFCLLGIRMTIRLSRPKPRPSLARLAEQEEQEAPEWDPQAPVQRFAVAQSPQAAPVSPQVVQSTQPDMRPLYEELSETAKLRYRPLAEDAELAEGEFNFPKAAKLWAQIGRWREAARCHQKAGNTFEAAQIYLALDMNIRAFPLLKEALGNSPVDERIRLRLIETLFDMGEADEAENLVRAALGMEGPAAPSVDFLAKLGRRYEAAHLLDRASEMYQLALAREEGQVEVEARISFLRQLKRLTDKGSAPGGDASPARELLEKFMADSTANVRALAAIERQPPTAPATQSLGGHEVIVGHLALGFQKPEPTYSVRSKFSISRRFMLQNLISQNERCTVFMARDRLLDSPVALKLYRLSSDFSDMDLLRERLLAIAQLNHPNLAKLTFVDREGPVLRIATEFLPGGNLTDYLNKLGGVGLPLILRMALHISSAIHTAHVRGVPHGDLRPENLIIGPDQRIKIVDFAMSTTPVRVADDPDLDISESTGGSSGDFRENVAATEAVQGDILQFGEVLDFMLRNSRQTADLTQSSMIADSIREIQELVEKTRQGSFTSILSVWQILHEVFERTMPSSSRSDQRKV